jgi:hypothetical protein
MNAVVLCVVVSLLGLGAAACRDGGGCTNDNDCKGARVCERGACVDAKAVAPPASPSTAATDPRRVASELPAPSILSCEPCSTQEDFDAASKRGQKCCPAISCHEDGECSSGRVCCRIPDGQLCADASRCGKNDRVQRDGARDTSSFACGTVRCRAGQSCCPMGSRCLSSGTCDDGVAADKGEIADYAPFSNTNVGYTCNPKTNEPCSAGETCRIGKVGRSPMTMTSSCQK